MPRCDDPNHIGQLMLDNLLEDPEAIAQIDGATGAEETRGSLRIRGIKVAQHMTKLGLKVGDITTVCAYNHNDYCLPLMGGLQIGVATNYLDMIMSERECKHMVTVTQSKAVFCDPPRAEMFHRISQETGLNFMIIVFGKVSDKRFISIEDFYNNDYSTEDPTVVQFDTSKTYAYIMCSSGSTGLPKGVCHYHKPTMYRIKALRPLFNGDSCILFGSNYWVSCLLMTVMNFCIKLLKVNSMPCTPELFFKYVEKYRVNAINITPYHLRLILRDPYFEKADLTSINKFFLGGGNATLDDYGKLQRKLNPGVPILNGFGISETGGVITWLPQGETYNPESVGRLMPMVEHKIIDVETNKILTEPNQLGELLVRGPMLMAGYLNNPKATAEAINEDGWYCTGDLCRIDEKGDLFVVDRLKELFHYYGHAIAPTAVELVINTLPGVAECGVIGIHDDDAGEIPLAFVRRLPGSNLTADEVKNIVKKNLGTHYELRGGVAFVESFEQTVSGKLKRYTLKKLLDTAKIE